MNGKTSTIINSMFAAVIMVLLGASWADSARQFDRVDRSVEKMQDQYSELAVMEPRLRSLETLTSQILTIVLAFQPAIAANGSNLDPGDYIIANNTGVYVELGGVPRCNDVVGTSMEPTIFEGAWACAVDVDVTTLKQHDIIIYHYPPTNSVILHPIYMVTEDEEGWWALAWGYNNAQPDYFKVREEHVLGKVVLIWRE